MPFGTHDVLRTLLGLGALLALARLLGELAGRLRQPPVVGEILAGIILGRTILGVLAPGVADRLFPRTGPASAVMSGIGTLAVIAFLFVAGLEMDLASVRRRAPAAGLVALGGILVPFGIGLGIARGAPALVGGDSARAPLAFSLFFATALAISALPVIVRTLMDLGLYRSELGSIVVAAAMLDDLVGWLLFAFVLGLSGNGVAHSGGLGTVICETAAFAVFVLVVLRRVAHRALPWILAHTSGTSAMMGLSFALVLLSAALTEWIGLHAAFGALLVGIALGDSSHFSTSARSAFGQFTSSVLVPLFFGSIGIRVDFAAQFQWKLALVVLVVSCIGKLLGCGVAARCAGIEWRQAWAIGFGMNSRGAMEIILGMLALQFGLIGEPLFVALVLMALVTSVTSGPAMMVILRFKRLPASGKDRSGAVPAPEHGSQADTPAVLPSQNQAAAEHHHLT